MAVAAFPADIATLIGYTRAPTNGKPLDMDDLASDKVEFRDVRRAYVRDVRGSEGLFTLNCQGFEYFKLPVIPGEGVVDFSNEQDPKILTIYYPAMEEWFAKVTGAKKVVIFDHIVRNEPYYPREKYSMGIRGPAARPHVDVTHAYAPEMFRDVQSRFGKDLQEIERIVNSRYWQSFNIWRPIQTVKRDPLALLDTRSASRDQLVPASFDRGDGHIVSMDWLKSDLRLDQPDNVSNHKWYYLSRQQPDEVVAFKIYDSDPASSSNGTPHTAVHIPGTEENETRASIEVRCFAIYEY